MVQGRVEPSAAAVRSSAPLLRAGRHAPERQQHHQGQREQHAGAQDHVRDAPVVASASSTWVSGGSISIPAPIAA